MCVWGPKAVKSGAAESRENRTEQKASEVKEARRGIEEVQREGKRKRERENRRRRSESDRERVAIAVRAEQTSEQSCPCSLGLSQ